MAHSKVPCDIIMIPEDVIADNTKTMSTGTFACDVPRWDDTPEGAMRHHDGTCDDVIADNTYMDAGWHLCVFHPVLGWHTRRRHTKSMPIICDDAMTS